MYRKYYYKIALTQHISKLNVVLLTISWKCRYLFWHSDKNKVQPKLL